MIKPWTSEHKEINPSTSRSAITAATSNTGKMLKNMLSSRKKIFSPSICVDSVINLQTQGLQYLHSDITLNIKSITSTNNFPTIIESPNISRFNLLSQLKSGLMSTRKQKSKVLSLEQQDKLVIKSQWRELGKYQMFDDYLRIRDASGLKSFKNEYHADESDKKIVITDKKPQLFSSEEQEKAYQEDQRKRDLDVLKEALLKNSSSSIIVKSSFFGGGEDLTILSQKKEIRIIHECLRILDNVKIQLKLCSIEMIQPLFEQLINLFSHFGIVNFYLNTVFLNCLILQSYGRSRTSYLNWKKYLRTCNIQGSSHHKYKLIAYKHLSKCCLDLGKLDKSLIYLKKMLKLSWVVDDRNYELLSYDMISVTLYYHRDLVKASFFHEKFVQGDYEEKNSGVRAIGEQNYIFSQELKMRLMDKNSFSEDDFDLETIIQKSNLEMWAKEQVNRELYKQQKLNEKLTFYKKGASFAKQDDRKYQEHAQQQKAKIQKFKNKWSEQLGPIFRKADSDRDPIKDLLMNRKVAVPGSNVPVMINHQSPVRQLSQYLFQREQGIQKMPDDQLEDLVFKPVEQIKILSKLINVFQFDLRFYSKHYILFIDALHL